MTEQKERENTVSYFKEIQAENGQQIYESGTDVLKYLKEKMELTDAGLEDRVYMVQVFGRQRDIHIQCREEMYAQELLSKLPEMDIVGSKYVGERATPEIYDHRPRIVRIYLHDVPMTMSNVDIIRELRQHCFFTEGTRIYDDLYKGTKILNGSRYITVRSVFSKAGIPLNLKVKGYNIRTWHAGQVRDRVKHQNIVWQEKKEQWQQRERERRERENANNGTNEQENSGMDDEDDNDGNSNQNEQQADNGGNSTQTDRDDDPPPRADPATQARDPSHDEPGSRHDMQNGTAKDTSPAHDEHEQNTSVAKPVSNNDQQIDPAGGCNHLEWIIPGPRHRRQSSEKKKGAVIDHIYHRIETLNPYSALSNLGSESESQETTENDPEKPHQSTRKEQKKKQRKSTEKKQTNNMEDKTENDNDNDNVFYDKNNESPSRQAGLSTTINDATPEKSVHNRTVSPETLIDRAYDEYCVKKINMEGENRDLSTSPIPGNVKVTQRPEVNSGTFESDLEDTGGNGRPFQDNSNRHDLFGWLHPERRNSTSGVQSQQEPKGHTRQSSLDMISLMKSIKPISKASIGAKRLGKRKATAIPISMAKKKDDKKTPPSVRDRRGTDV